MSDLDDIFDPHYAAVDLFTNRISEHTAFSVAILNHAQRLTDGVATLDVPARRNVLSFFGIGGIGKTALSKRLERWLLGELPNTDWGGPPRFDQSFRTARIDFHGSRVVSAIDVVLAVRAALAGEGRRFPAFDVGLAAWWSLARPGQPLPALSDGTGFDVRAQVVDTVGDVIGDAGLGWGIGPFSVRTGVRIVDAIRTNRLRDRLVRQCAPLVAITEAARRDPSQDVAASLAGLLSWDLQRLVVGERPIGVVFADAVEYVQGGDRVQERLLNRIVHLTPSILWVVTSQRSLDWADPTLCGVLPKAGPAIWPGLDGRGEEEPRQHLVGDLVDEDIVRYLRRASGSGGFPVLSEEVMDRIRHGSHGLPLYLDLSLSIAQSAPGEKLEPSSFGGPLPALVTRVFADLPPEEREVARTASLLPRFNPTVVAEAAKQLEGDALRFCSRALVRTDDHPRFPYRLHDVVRAALTEEMPSTPGSWSAGDRLARAHALMEVLRRRHDAVLDDIDCRLDLLQLAAGVCAAHDIEAPWLRKALLELPGLARTAERLPPPDARTWMGQVSRFFEGWRGRTGSERRVYLEELLQTDLPKDVARAARLFLAYSYRTSGYADRALPILQALLADEPDSSLLRYQVGRTLHTLGRYEELDDLLRRFPPAQPTEANRLRSDLSFERGHLAEAIAGAASRAEHLDAVGQHRVALENRSAALWRSALAGRTTAPECDVMIAKADRYGMHLVMRTALAAKVICLVGDEAAVTGILTEASSVIEASAGREGWREWTAELLHALRLDDRQRVAAVHGRWRTRVPSCTANYRLVDRLLQTAGYKPTYPPLTDADDAERRWQSIIAAIVNPVEGIGSSSR